MTQFDRLEGSEDLSYLRGELWQAVPGLWHSILTTLTWGRPGPARSCFEGGRSLQGRVWLSRVATCRVTKMEAHLFRVTLMRRLQHPSSLLCVPAGVASLSTLWATTVQRARVRGFWGSEGGLWRVLQHGSAAKVEVE